MALRYTPVKLRRPDSLTDDYPPFAQLNAIEVVELEPPEGEAAIHWRLLTTHPVDSVEQAQQNYPVVSLALAY